MSRLFVIVKGTFRACLSIFRIRTAEGFQYRVAGLSGAATGIFWALIQITVYTIFYTYANNKNAGLMAGLTLQQLISYSWLQQIFFPMQPMSIDGEIRQKIISGDVGIEMCRPLDLYSHWFAKIAAGRLTPLFWRGTITLLAGLLIPLSYRLSGPASFEALIWSLLSLFSAFLLCTAYGMLVCSVRLNITWGEGPTYIIMLIGGVLSGAYLPLQLWPQFMQGFLMLQPFAGYLDIPLRLYLGTLNSREALWAVGIQLVWVLVFIVLGRLIMHRRLKSIIVQGG